MVDRDWSAIHAVVMRGLEDYESADGEARVSPRDREEIADVVTDHLAASLESGVLRTQQQGEPAAGGGRVSQRHKWDLEPTRSVRWVARHATAICVACVVVVVIAAVMAVQSLMGDDPQGALVWGLLAAAWLTSPPSVRGIARSVRAYDDRKPSAD